MFVRNQQAYKLTTMFTVVRLFNAHGFIDLFVVFIIIVCETPF